MHIDTCTPHESLIEAKAVMASLEIRASGPDASIADLAEHSVLTATVRKIEGLLTIAREYEEMLGSQVRRTQSRIAN